MVLWALITAAFASSDGVLSIAEVHRFSLSEPMTFHWTAGAPAMDKGTILVVEVDGNTAKPRQTAGATLFVGSAPAAVTHPGYRDGYMVVFVPGHIDMNETRVFWGHPERLPEQISLRQGAELSASDPTPVLRPERIFGTIELKNERKLYGHIAELIIRYAPADADFAHGYRLAAEL